MALLMIMFVKCCLVSNLNILHDQTLFDNQDKIMKPWCPNWMPNIPRFTSWLFRQIRIN